MKQPFVNEAFTKAVNDYLENKDNKDGVLYNSFLVVFIRLLIVIYNELDIITPFKMESLEMLKNNLMKFDYAEEKINNLFVNLQMYYEIEKENQGAIIKKDNPYFITIQKQLIDMLIAKKLNFHLTEKEAEDFYSILYTPYSHNPLIVSYNYLTAKDMYEVDMYYKKEMAENVKIQEVKQKNFLNLKAYEILGYSSEKINAMSADELDKLNHQVYDHFKIRENAINKEYLLEKAIEALETETGKFTSGNGYVDILLVMAVISTVIMVIAVVML